MKGGKYILCCLASLWLKAFTCKVSVCLEKLKSPLHLALFKCLLFSRLKASTEIVDVKYASHKMDSQLVSDRAIDRAWLLTRIAC